jgi:plasmid stabilization system protein ParE
MNVIWSESAVGHLEGISDYLSGEGVGATEIVRRRILETVRRVGVMPHSGRTGRIAGTREAVVPRTPYIVVYQVSVAAVEILGIWHGARLWPETF